uniref:Uncharacterized protein n=1 Tax=viral metagenome TaxID=1070528 RepID=A0A6C0DPH8_9ZZZZ
MTTTVWMCKIETNDVNNGWKTECIFPQKSKNAAMDRASRIITQDLWEVRYTCVSPDDNDIIANLMCIDKDKESGEYVAEWESEEEFFSNIRVTVWDTTM